MMETQLVVERKGHHLPPVATDQDPTYVHEEVVP